MMELTPRMSRNTIIVRGNSIPYRSPLSTKDLCLVVSIQTNCTWNTSLPLNREVIFYPIKVFSSSSHADSSFVGASDISQISVPYKYVLWACPAYGQTLDVHQRPDDSSNLGRRWRGIHTTPSGWRGILATSPPSRRTAVEVCIPT